MGIHTGLVVVGEMGGAGRQEQLALGEMPNIAARIQGLAAPNTVAISEATYRLVQGYFDCQDLGAQTLRGVAEPLHVYRVLRKVVPPVASMLRQPRGLTPLVGRESEVTLLLERWEQVKAGQGQVVLLRVMQALARVRLVQMLKEHVANEPHMRWECRSSEYYQNTALFPLTDLFQRLLRFQAEDTPDEKLGKLEQALSQYRLPLEESVPLFAPLLSLPFLKIAILRSICHHNVNGKRRSKPSSRSSWNLLNINLSSLSWKTCTGPTQRPWNCLNLVIEQTPTASCWCCSPVVRIFNLPGITVRISLRSRSTAYHTPRWNRLSQRMTDGKTFPAEVLHRLLRRRMAYHCLSRK